MCQGQRHLVAMGIMTLVRQVQKSKWCDIVIDLQSPQREEVVWGVNKTPLTVHFLTTVNIGFVDDYKGQ